MNFEPDTVELAGLDKLLKALKAKPPVARIGILGDKAARKEETSKKGASNAEIGAVHEYGSIGKGIPQRSFLRVPLADHLEKEMEESGALSDEESKQVIKQGSVIPWLKKIAVLAEGVVRKGFDTGGFGKWAPHSKGYQNNTGMVLVDTTQLRDSIVSEVKD